MIILHLGVKQGILNKTQMENQNISASLDRFNKLLYQNITTAIKRWKESKRYHRISKDPTISTSLSSAHVMSNSYLF